MSPLPLEQQPEMRVLHRHKKAKQPTTKQRESLSGQMNVRMNKDLHEQGCAAFAEIGVNPSEAVRALWEKAAKCGKDLAEVKALLFASTSNDYTKEDLTFLEEGQRIVVEGMAKLGIDTSAWPHEGFPSYSDIEQQVRIEQLQEEGFIDG